MTKNFRQTYIDITNGKFLEPIVESILNMEDELENDQNDDIEIETSCTCDNGKKCAYCQNGIEGEPEVDMEEAAVDPPLTVGTYVYKVDNALYKVITLGDNDMVEIEDKNGNTSYISQYKVSPLNRQEWAKKRFENQKNEPLQEEDPEVDMEEAAPAPEKRPIYTIAREIRRDWGNVNYAAKPYLEAMSSLDSIDDNYGQDSGRSVVAYFLSNASSWKGPKAKEIKLELKSLLKR